MSIFTTLQKLVLVGSFVTIAPTVYAQDLHTTCEAEIVSSLLRKMIKRTDLLPSEQKNLWLTQFANIELSKKQKTAIALAQEQLLKFAPEEILNHEAKKFNDFEAMQSIENRYSSIMYSTEVYPYLSYMIARNLGVDTKSKLEFIWKMQFTEYSVKRQLCDQLYASLPIFDAIEEKGSYLDELNLTISNGLIEDHSHFIMTIIGMLGEDDLEVDIQPFIDVYEFNSDEGRLKFLRMLRDGSAQGRNSPKNESQLATYNKESKVPLANLINSVNFKPSVQRRKIYFSNKVKMRAPKMVRIIENSNLFNDTVRGIYSRNYNIAVANLYGSRDIFLNEFDELESQIFKVQARYEANKSASQADAEYMLGATLAIAGLYAVGKMFVDGTKDAWANSSDYSYTGSSASSSSQNTSSRKSSGSAGSSGGQSGYKWLEEIDYSRGQKIIARGKCNNGSRFNVEYYPDNGYSSRFYIYSTSGSSKDDVAAKFCR